MAQHVYRIDVYRPGHKVLTKERMGRILEGDCGETIVRYIIGWQE